MQDKVVDTGIAGIVIFLVIILLREVNKTRQKSVSIKPEPQSGELSPDFWRREFREAVEEQVRDLLLPINEKLDRVLKDTEVIRRANYDIINIIGPIKSIMEIVIQRLGSHK